MSFVPFNTQIDLQQATQNSQITSKAVLVYIDKMTERQSALMQECQEYLNQHLGILVRPSSELDQLSPQLRLFVVPHLKEDLIKSIRNRFEKSRIYLPRAVIEARGFYRVELPVRTRVISLTMYKSRVFLVKSCDQPDIKSRLYEMSGYIVGNFNDDFPNVVITDRADNRYCSKAHKRGIPVVSRDWVDENYNIALEDTASSFNYDAMSNVRSYQIRPFYGLHFKFDIDPSNVKVKQLITENQGHVIYGNEGYCTHIVGNSEISECDTNKASQKPRVVDVNFLSACIQSGYHLTKREYRELTDTSSRSVIKQEPMEQETCDQSSNGYMKLSENQTMFPPPPAVRQHKQPDDMDNMILKALSTFGNAQTQLASTQMRRLPDPELRIEQTYEPSQQLYWNDGASRSMNTKVPTILTNLQRGNVKQESPILLHQRTIHELAAQGELFNIEPNMVDAPDTNNMTPLFWAAGYGQNLTVDFLIRSGANPNYKSNGGKTALMLAASKGYFHVVKTLIAEGSNMNETDEAGNSALIYATHQNQGLVVQELLRSGADLNITNVYGQTAYSISLSKQNKSAQASLEAHFLSLLKGQNNSNQSNWH